MFLFICFAGQRAKLSKLSQVFHPLTGNKLIKKLKIISKHGGS